MSIGTLLPVEKTVFPNSEIRVAEDKASVGEGAESAEQPSIMGLSTKWRSDRVLQ
jgi:hypothetical protein